MGEVAKQFYELLNVRKKQTVSHRPESDGTGEAFVKLTGQIMQALFGTEKLETGMTDANWHVRLPYVELALNSTPSTTTGLSPFLVAFGTEMNLPSSLFLTIPRARQTVPQAVRDLQARQQKIFDIVFENSAKTARATKRYYDSKAIETDEHYSEGQTVLYRNFISSTNEPKSFQTLFSPVKYTILKRLGVNYVIAPKDDPTKTKVVHFNHIVDIQERSEADEARTRELRVKDTPKRFGFNIDDVAEGAIH